jgi:hypothetical protein
VDYTVDIESKIPSSPVIGGSLGLQIRGPLPWCPICGKPFGSSLARCHISYLFIYLILLFICFTVTQFSYRSKLLYSIFYIPYSIFYILYSLFFILYSLFFILYSLFFILYSIFPLWMSIPHLYRIPFLLRILFPTSFSIKSQTDLRWRTGQSPAREEMARTSSLGRSRLHAYSAHVQVLCLYLDREADGRYNFQRFSPILPV